MDLNFYASVSTRDAVLKKESGDMRSFALAILIAVAIEGSGQDALTVDPGHYKIEFEDASVRVVRVHFYTPL